MKSEYHNSVCRYQDTAQISNPWAWDTCVFHSGGVEAADHEVQGAGGQAGDVRHNHRAVDSRQWSTYQQTYWYET